MSVADGQLRLATMVTGELAALRGDDPEEVALYPADDSGDFFVCRSFEDEPWSPVMFSRLADQTPYLYVFGRVTVRTG